MKNMAAKYNFGLKISHLLAATSKQYDKLNDFSLFIIYSILGLPFSLFRNFKFCTAFLNFTAWFEMKKGYIKRLLKSIRSRSLNVTNRRTAFEIKY